jgi:hypothetical protein
MFLVSKYVRVLLRRPLSMLTWSLKTATSTSWAGRMQGTVLHLKGPLFLTGFFVFLFMLLFSLHSRTGSDFSLQA